MMGLLMWLGAGHREGANVNGPNSRATGKATEIVSVGEGEGSRSDRVPEPT
jgi:hypothetical protein